MLLYIIHFLMVSFPRLAACPFMCTFLSKYSRHRLLGAAKFGYIKRLGLFNMISKLWPHRGFINRCRYSVRWQLKNKIVAMSSMRGLVSSFFRVEEKEKHFLDGNSRPSRPWLPLRILWEGTSERNTKKKEMDREKKKAKLDYWKKKEKKMEREKNENKRLRRGCQKPTSVTASLAVFSDGDAAPLDTFAEFGKNTVIYI